MQMTFDLKDDLAQQLKTIPDIDDFVNQVINKAFLVPKLQLGNETVKSLITPMTTKEKKTIPHGARFCLSSIKN